MFTALVLAMNKNFITNDGPYLLIVRDKFCKYRSVEWWLVARQQNQEYIIIYLNIMTLMLVPWILRKNKN